MLVMIEKHRSSCARNYDLSPLPVPSVEGRVGFEVMTSAISLSCCQINMGNMMNPLDNCPLIISCRIVVYIYIWVRSSRCGCLVTWFCYHLIAKPGNKTGAPSWPRVHSNRRHQNSLTFPWHLPDSIHISLTKCNNKSVDEGSKEHISK